MGRMPVHGGRDIPGRGGPRYTWGDVSPQSGREPGTGGDVTLPPRGDASPRRTSDSHYACASHSYAWASYSYAWASPPPMFAAFCLSVFRISRGSPGTPSGMETRVMPRCSQPGSTVGRAR